MSIRTSALRSLALAAFAAVFACLALAATAPAKIERGPAGPKFYDPPSQLPKGHGKLIWRRNASNVIPLQSCLLYTSPSPRDGLLSRMPSSA